MGGKGQKNGSIIQKKGQNLLVYVQKTVWEAV